MRKKVASANSFHGTKLDWAAGRLLSMDKYAHFRRLLKANLFD